MSEENPFQNLKKNIAQKKADDWVATPAQRYLEHPTEKEVELARFTFQMPQAWYDQIVTKILPTMYGNKINKNGNKIKPTLSLYLRELIEKDFKERQSK